MIQRVGDASTDSTMRECLERAGVKLASVTYRGGKISAYVILTGMGPRQMSPRELAAYCYGLADGRRATVKRSTMMEVGA